MFKIVSNYILHSYKSESYIIRQKSEYFLMAISLIIFLLLILVSMDLFSTKTYIYEFGDIIFLLACSFILLCLKNNKLEKAINIYIVGYIFILFTEEIISNLMPNIYLSQYNVLDLVINLAVGLIIISLVSIKKYQMYIILYFSILSTLLDCIIIYIKINGNNYNVRMITDLVYYFIIVLAGCIICILHFKINYEAIRILDNQKCQLSTFDYCDNLTGLLNRKKLIETINILLFNKNERFAVLFIDLDNYKNINDNFGHQNGDNVLIIVSGRLKSIIGLDDTLYRIGGDEFIIILKNLKSGAIAEKFAQNIKNILNPAIVYNEKKLYVGASIGISLFPEHGSDSDTLLDYADLAMAKVKNNGGNGYKIYSSQMKNISIDKLSMQIKLHEALKNNEFISYYQPILDLKLMKIIGAETLIRWRQGNKIILPIEFISIAKNVGELVEIDNDMIKKACIQCKRWHDMGLKDFYISVNTSFNQLISKNFIKLVTDLLRNYSLPATYLCFEITEDEVMQNPDLIIKILSELRAIGVKIYLDDFGKGYSSLSYVNTLPIDIIKIDMSLIKNLDKDSKNILIVKSTINMAHSLNIKIVSEGVETREQFNILNDLECDFIQGYFCGKPIPAIDFEQNFVDEQITL